MHVAQPTHGGAARVTADLAGDQVQRGWEVAVASPGHGLLVELLEGSGAEHVLWEAIRSPAARSLAEVRRLATIVRAAAPDVIHLHSSKAGLAGRLAVRGRSCTVFQPHGWSFEAVRGPVRRAAIAWERHAVSWTDAIVCVSHAERERGVRHGVRGPYSVVPNGVDLTSLREAGPDERAAARRQLGLNGGPLAVCVGRIDRAKGQDLCVEAWSSFVGVPGAQLILVGDGPARPALQRRARPGIRFVGARDDVPVWLAAADVVVAPSRWEGMSLSVLEAMAVGRSVVAFDAPGMRELLGEEAGAIVPIGDLRALADALVRRLVEPGLRAEEGRRARLRAERSHDFATTAQQIADLYAAALRGPRRPPSEQPR
jgi:glycosyltransferase involved in cell wall biosynthesis